MYQILDSKLKELAALIPVNVFSTETTEQYDKMLGIKLTLQDKIKTLTQVLETEFIGTYPEHSNLRNQMRKIQVAFNKFVDKQVRYENLNDPIAKMAQLASQSPEKMYKNSMIEFHILDGK